MAPKKKGMESGIAAIMKGTTDTAKDTQGTLAKQGDQLNKAELNLDEVGKVMEDVHKDLGYIKRARGVFGLCFTCCCDFGERKEKIVLAEHPLPKKEVEANWSKRYDPNEKWYAQISAGLDRLIALAEDMNKTLKAQEKQAKRMADKAKAHTASVKSARDTMAEITKSEKGDVKENEEGTEKKKGMMGKLFGRK